MLTPKKVTGIILTALVVISFTVFAFKILEKEDIFSQLRSLGYENLQTRNIKFEGYDSQKIVAIKASGSIIRLQSVKDVEPNLAGNMIEKFERLVVEAQRNFTTSDPYVGTIIDLSVPENLKPIKETTNINDKSITYYMVHTNEIFSLQVLSELEVKFKGLISMHYCEVEKTVYNLEVYFKLEDFDKEMAVDVLSFLYCR